ncbi:Hsp70-Hsp90 organizing protein 3 [Hondaea fermentalgiana]|uniref:Hsp70-Hsp90 organizing protein 3 n=1 Tax=Hondaea fermentalgiana TaxID=2315210 RepID=A0A2R5G5J6_9STRA|nr:Hsp70-Hsp90 organizing protein 3 [Hondaea fermentalgiana]|eukprot:GBG26306.1 Hsp70-Hsp90 organizing protein 3 [Hondaea fermentalgiana]
MANTLGGNRRTSGGQAYSSLKSGKLRPVLGGDEPEDEAKREEKTNADHLRLDAKISHEEELVVAAPEDQQSALAAQEEKDAAIAFEENLKSDIGRAQSAGRQAIEDGDLIGAVACYTEAIEMLDGEEYPRWKAKLLLRRARTHALRGGMFQCIDDAAEAAALEPTMQKAYVLQGHALLATQQYGPASECFRRGLRDHPHDADLRQGFEEALRCIQSSRHNFVRCSEGPQLCGENFAEVTCGDFTSIEESNWICNEAKRGLSFDIKDVFDTEKERLHKRGLDQDPYNALEELEEILSFLHRARVELFTLFCAYLNFPRDAPTADAAMKLLNDRKDAAMTGSGKEKQKRRMLDLSNSSRGVGSALDPRRIPLGRWTRMTEEQFYHFAERHLLTDSFDETHVASVWAQIVQDSARTSSRSELETIGFPKFIEGVARLACRRYHARTVDRAERGAQTVPISQRLFYAFDKHILASSEVYSTLRAEVARASVYDNRLRIKLLSVPSTIVVRKSHEHKLSRVYDYFKPATEEAMSMQELLDMCLRIRLVDKRGRNLDDIKDAAVAAIRFTGDLSLRCISFSDFGDILLFWCDVLSRDADIVPFNQRLEAFISERIVKPAQRHAGLRASQAHQSQK